MYNISVTEKLQLDDVEAGSIVAQVLMKDFEFICDSISLLRNRRDLKSFELDDLKADLEIKEAMKTLLRYYLTHNEYLEFMELQRVYGNE